MDARTRKLAGLAIVAVGIVVAVLGGLADQIGIGANDDGEMGGKQVAALVVGLLLIAGGIVVATVLAKDEGGDDITTSSADVGEATPTPAAGTPVVDVADADVDDDTAAADDDPADPPAEAEAAAEPVEATDSSD